MTYDIFMGINPPTATDQHVGHRIARVNGKQLILSYRKRPQKLAHQLYESCLKKDIRNRTDGIGTIKMFTGAIRVNIDFCFAHGTNVAKRDRNKTFARIVRPDVDNMAKGLLDCLMSVGLIQDDATIFDLHLRKFNVPQGFQGVRVTITDDFPEWTNNDGKENN